MVVAYRLDILAKPLKLLPKQVNSFVLPNIILGTNEIPEFLDAESAPEHLAAALLPLLRAGSLERALQLAAFERLDRAMARPVPPSVLAADIVLKTVAWAVPPPAGGAGRLAIGVDPGRAAEGAR